VLQLTKSPFNIWRFSEGDNWMGKANRFCVSWEVVPNGRIEDFRPSLHCKRQKKKADNVTGLVVPGSHKVESAIKEEGILDMSRGAGLN